MRAFLPENRPLLILAPMQDITDLDFWRVLSRYGGPDIYYTEYFRVHRDSRPERHILRSIDENPDGKPIIAQMIGQDLEALQRTALDLQKRRITGIDINFGCPAPIVCRKDAGGGLLRHPEKIDEILRVVRASVHLSFTVKTRIGFDSPDEFPTLLDLFRRHPIDALTVHGRTVREMYKPVVHYDAIERAARLMPCPVFANGNVTCLDSARRVVGLTNASGLMIGARRDPQPVALPTNPPRLEWRGADAAHVRRPARLHRTALRGDAQSRGSGSRPGRQDEKIPRLYRARHRRG